MAPTAYEVCRVLLPAHGDHLAWAQVEALTAAGWQLVSVTANGNWTTVYLQRPVRPRQVGADLETK